MVPTLATDDLPLAVLRIDPYAKLVWLDAAAAQRRLAPPRSCRRVLARELYVIEMEAFARQFVDQLSDQAGDQDALNGQKVHLPSSSRAASSFLPPLLRLDARQLVLLRGQLGETSLFFDGRCTASAAPISLPNCTRDCTTARSRSPTPDPRCGNCAAAIRRNTCCANHRSDLRQVRGEGGEQSSKILASLAGQVLHDRTADAEKRSLAASVLTQAPNKPPRTRKSKPA